eukprot:IDg9010t1
MCRPSEYEYYKIFSPNPDSESAITKFVAQIFMVLQEEITGGDLSVLHSRFNSFSMADTSEIQVKIEAKILELVAARSDGKTVCPSEVVRALDSSLPRGWRAEMSTVRDIGYRLAREGQVSILQRGKVVPSTSFPARGPIRI